MKIGKKEKSIQAAGLAHVEMQPVGKDRFALVLTDTKQETTGYLLTPEGLRVLLVPLLGLAVEWSEHTDLSLDTLVGPRQLLPATRIVVEKVPNGRDARLRVFLGKTELTFLIPLKAVIDGLSSIVPMITRERGH